MTRRPKPAEAAPGARPPTLTRVELHTLVPNPRNPRQHSAEQLARLQAALERDGQTKPILARRENAMIIAGHGITMAAAALGWTELDVVLLDVDQAAADRIMLADNRLGELSTNDRDLVMELLSGIDAADFFATGFSAEEIEKLQESFDEQIEVVEIETGQVSDDFWISVRGPLPHQAQVLAKLKGLLREYPEVKIDLGTVPGR